MSGAYDGIDRSCAEPIDIKAWIEHAVQLEALVLNCERYDASPEDLAKALAEYRAHLREGTAKK